MPVARTAALSQRGLAYWDAQSLHSQTAAWMCKETKADCGVAEHMGRHHALPTRCALPTLRQTLIQRATSAKPE